MLDNEKEGPYCIEEENKDVKENLGSIVGNGVEVNGQNVTVTRVEYVRGAETVIHFSDSIEFEIEVSTEFGSDVIVLELDEIEVDIS